MYTKCTCIQNVPKSMSNIYECSIFTSQLLVQNNIYNISMQTIFSCNRRVLKYTRICGLYTFLINESKGNFEKKSFLYVFPEAKKIYMCVYRHMSKKIQGRSVGNNFFIFFLYITIGKTGNSRSGIRFRYFIVEISGKPSFAL